MNEQQFKLLVGRFALVQAEMWQLVAAYGQEAASEAPGPLKAMQRRLRKILQEVAALEGCLSEAERAATFLLELAHNQEPAKRK